MRTIIVNARFLTQSLTGVQRFAVEISLELKKMMGKQIKFVAPDAIVQKDYAEALCVEIIGTQQGHMWEQWDLPRYLKKQGSPLLLCLCNTAPLCYKNKMVTVHDVAFEAYPQTFNKMFLWLYQFMVPKIIKNSKHVLTVSEFSKQEIMKYYNTSSEKISVVYNAVNNLFRKIDDKELQQQQYILAVSSMNYRKNFVSVLKAFDLFEKSNQDTNLFIIGDLKSESFSEIDLSKYKNNSRIHFLGRVSDEELIRYYSNAKAFIFPSIYEGFGIPPLEAQSCGCLVLSADIPPLREVLQKSAIYFDPYNVKDIVNKMIGLQSTDINLLKYLGNENVKRFSWYQSAYEIANIIKN